MAALVLSGDTNATSEGGGESPGPSRSLPRLERQLTGTYDQMLDDDNMDLTDQEQGNDLLAGNFGTGEKAGSSSAVSGADRGRAAPTGQNVNISFRVAGIKDEGVAGKQNQDDFFVWSSGDTHVIVVLDGHGRELGQLASKAAKASMFADLTSSKVLSALLSTPKETLTQVFVNANNAIRSAFREHYKNLNIECQEEEGGFLLKRNRSRTGWNCVHGGSTASVAVILDGGILISANVGDSTSLLCGLGNSTKPSFRFSTFEPESCENDPENKGFKSYAVVTAEHSPETPSEYVRMRNFRPCPQRGKNFSEMLFVYDAPSYSKYDCPSVFNIDPSTGYPAVTNNGRYYKSVRSEWATLVTTPPSSRFQDALAFTRSIGDLHLQTYGVSCEPDVCVIDLKKMFQARTNDSDWVPGTPGLLMVCSDGIWDNWKFPDVVTHFANNEKMCLAPNTNAARGSDTKAGHNIDNVTQGTHKETVDMVTRFMAVNKAEAHKNFGNSADNMSAVMCVMYPSV